MIILEGDTGDTYSILLRDREKSNYVELLIKNNVNKNYDLDSLMENILVKNALRYSNLDDQYIKLGYVTEDNIE